MELRLQFDRVGCGFEFESQRNLVFVTLITLLFSRPPAPTVLVGPAHCTFLCKSSRDEVDNCCCGGANDCSDDIPRCGNLPKVVEMTGIIPGPCDYFFASRNSHQSIHIQPENQEIVCPIKKEVNQGSRVTSRNTPRL